MFVSQGGEHDVGESDGARTVDLDLVFGIDVRIRCRDEGGWAQGDVRVGTMGATYNLEHDDLGVREAGLEGVHCGCAVDRGNAAEGVGKREELVGLDGSRGEENKRPMGVMGDTLDFIVNRVTRGMSDHVIDVIIP